MGRKKFKVNDMVMAVDRGKLYEAKILRIESVGKDVKYFIHYNMWDRKYDAWIDESLLAAKTDALAVSSLSASAKKEHAEKKKGKDTGKKDVAADEEPDNALLPESAPSAPDDENTNTIQRPKRQRSSRFGDDSAASDVKQPENIPQKKRTKKEADISFELHEAASRKQVKLLAESELCTDENGNEKLNKKIGLPFAFKKFAVDEWSLVTKTTPITDRRLILLPRQYTVRDAIATFLCQKREVLSKVIYEDYLAFFQGLTIYFDKALPTILLYRQERAQFDFISRELPDKPPSEIYGCEHLSRLFLKFHRLMLGIVFASTHETEVFNKLGDFFAFLVKDLDTYFSLPDYVLAPEAMTVVSRDKKSYPDLSYPQEIIKGKISKSSGRDEEDSASDEEDVISEVMADEAVVKKTRGRKGKSTRGRRKSRS